MLAAISGASTLSHLSGIPFFAPYKLLIETGQGLIAIAAAVFSTVQTKLNYSKMADMHRAVAADYGAIRRNLRTTFHMPVHMRDNLRSYFDRVEKELHDLAKKSPQISKSIWASTDERLKKDPSSLMGKEEELDS